MTDYTAKQALIDELDAFDPHWRDRYTSLFDAATAADALGLYRDYLSSDLGMYERATLRASTDWNEVNRVNRALRDAEIRLANEGKR